MAKTKLPYLIQEALGVGGWKPGEFAKGTEIYTRGTTMVSIGTKAYHDTDPASYVFRVFMPEGFVSKRENIDKLCKRLAKK